MIQIQLIADDRDWNASYTIKGGKVCVASAYGADTAPVEDPDQAEAVALQIFEGIVKRWSPVTRSAVFKTGRPYAARR